ncbi:MAG: hypothetical protein ACR2QR_08685, partial [Woeseiaceae bacterium]
SLARRWLALVTPLTSCCRRPSDKDELMNGFGFLLLAAGFLAGAYSTALDIESTNWAMFVPAAIVAIVGVLMIKRQASGVATSESVLTANRTELRESLRSIVSNLDELISAGASLATENLRNEVDQRLRDDLRRFAEARGSLVHLYSLQTYANIMSEFAAGERYVNRVWSASADGYDGEARAYLERAVRQFREAVKQLEAVSS